MRNYYAYKVPIARMLAVADDGQNDGVAVESLYIFYGQQSLSLLLSAVKVINERQRQSKIH